MGTIYENEAPVERVILVAISERDETIPLLPRKNWQSLRQLQELR